MGVTFYYDHEIGEWMMKTPEENQSFSAPELRVCLHEYTLYEGFTDRFYYCKRCDSKHRDGL